MIYLNNKKTQPFIYTESKWGVVLHGHLKQPLGQSEFANDIRRRVIEMDIYSRGHLIKA